MRRRAPREAYGKLLREVYGLDKPLHVQYWNWLERGSCAWTSAGPSRPTAGPCSTKIGERLPITLLLNVVEMLIIVALAVPIGVLSATRQYSTFDKVTTIFVFVGFATPDFWLALLLMILFGVQLGWLPISGLRSLNWEYLSFWQQQWDFLSHLVLPIAGGHLRRAGRLLALHAAEHAGGGAPGLHPDGAGQGPGRAGGDRQARPAQRAAARSSPSSACRCPGSSAAASSSSRSSPSPAWASSWCRRSSRATTR